jgi:ankyrin repeat protein
VPASDLKALQNPGPAASGRQGQAGQGGGAQGGGGNNNGDDSTPAVIDFTGGMTPMMFAARQGNLAAVAALVAAGANVNQQNPGDKSTPMLVATVNGQFDIAMYLLQHGGDPNLASTANATPLYAALNVEWAPHAFYPQPSPSQQKTSHLQLMDALLKAGADPNVRLRNKLWYTGYNFDQSGVDAKGTTAFWRAAQAGDLPAMKLLIANGADPKIASIASNVRLPNGRTSADGTETPPAAATPPTPGAPAPERINADALLMASGAGYDGNFQVLSPLGFMPALKYLVEELHMDVNVVDAKGYSAIHFAAFRGDNAMINYLVSKGADPKVVAKDGMTTVDYANGPVQRLQPFPETIKLLEGLGAINNHKCKSC